SQMRRIAERVEDEGAPAPVREVVTYVDFDSFARAELPRLLSYAVVLTGDRHLAADVVQEAMVRAHQRWARVQATDRPELYVKRMVTNEYLSWRGRWQVRTVIAGPEKSLSRQAPASANHADRVAERDNMWQRLAGLP